MYKITTCNRRTAATAAATGELISLIILYYMEYYIEQSLNITITTTTTAATTTTTTITTTTYIYIYAYMGISLFTFQGTLK